MVHPPSFKPKPNRPGRPRKSFEDKERSAHHDEAIEIKEKVAGHEFQAVLLAAGLMAKDQGYRDLSFVLRKLAEDPLVLAKNVKEAITSPRQGISLKVHHSQAFCILILATCTISLFRLSNLLFVCLRK